ncbi:MAG TPA: hypothetical protein VFQ36_24295, partial [Ktedonobacteraceae bacterium]|nr:hypothetical protein [Ktedonobacteraceae bacterium]
VLARYAQHLACREADSNENKDEWIRGVLVSGKLPPVHEIEKLATIEEGREREQYWIRYAISQGAKLLNRQITMTEQEKIERHARRAARYARIEEMLESGIYVKREGVWYPTSLLYRHTASWPSLLSLKDTYIPTEQGAKSLMDASHEEFTAFIGQYITIFDNGAKHWDWFGRTSSIAYAQRHGATPEFCDPPPQPEKKPRKRKKNGAV